MNAIELAFARHLLLWPAGLVHVNLAFLALAWAAAGTRPPWNLRARLRRHPIPIKAHFDQCLTLTYALPARVLRPLLPPGLELDDGGGHGFVAVALLTCGDGLLEGTRLSRAILLGPDHLLGV